MNKIIKFIRKLNKIIISAFITLIIFSSNTALAADTIESSRLGTGLKNLLTDASNYMLMIVPILSVAIVAYFFVRKAASDEMDHKRWQSRINTAIICGICAEVASAIINLVSGYFQ
ncbi:MAG: hypothetical protein FWD71_05230 [Oscillospiraceae bacterium]|nr:hypothetical protein [Oscillospiraceae bacterium]